MSGKPTLATLKAAAKARGIALTDAQAKPVLTGATWLKDCVTLLRKSGLGG